MHLPFTVEQFLDVFERFNAAIWPAQIGAYALGVIALALALRGGRGARAVPFLLAGAWAFVGAAYHLGFFAKVNPAARLFGWVFIAQALLFVFVGLRRPFAFRFEPGLRSAAGLALVAYAVVVYPLLGEAAGRAYPHAPVFGVAPCPTTIFTFGLLLLVAGEVPWWLIVIPVLWAAVGVSAALQLGIREDLGLVVAAVLVIALRTAGWRRARRHAAHV